MCQGELDLLDCGNAALGFIHRVIRSHIGQTVNVVKLLALKGRHRGILHQHFAVVQLADRFTVNGILIFILHAKSLGILSLVGLKLVVIKSCRHGIIDLIFGLSQMDDDLWRETLSKALSISASGRPPKHISAYQLSVEEDSMLEKLIAKGKWSEASDEVCERQYAILCETLAAAGYNHYEISNYAQPGFEAVHNSAYWNHRPYIGLGPGAHSYLVQVDTLSRNSEARCVEMAFSHPRVGGGAQLCWEGAFGTHWRVVNAESIRQWNDPDLKGYLAAAQNGNFADVQGSETLDQEQLIMEKVMLGLRTAAGVPEPYLRSTCDESLIDESLGNGNLVRLADGNIRIPENRFFISDNIISSII